MLKRKCSECGRELTRNRKDNLCQWCRSAILRKQLRMTNGGLANDGEKHRKLKIKAREFLISLGCKDIREEARDLSEESRFVYDVVGFKDGKIIIVECGGSQKHKLQRIIRDGYTLYIWPYGAKEPFLYNPSRNICDKCGSEI